MIKFMIETTCPYCGHKQNTLIAQRGVSPHPHVFVCDAEEGGCDCPYYVRVTLLPVVSVYQIEKQGGATPRTWEEG